MLSLLKRKRAAPAPSDPMELPEKDKGLLQPQPATALLATPRRRKLLEHIWERTSLSHRQFDTLYRLPPLERYTALVQLRPQRAITTPIPAACSTTAWRSSPICAQAAAVPSVAGWGDARGPGRPGRSLDRRTAYAALLHDIGKVAVDLHVEYADGAPWHPWHGPLQRPYRFRYRADREYRLHGAAAGLLYNQLLDRPIFDWLSGYPMAWSALLYSLTGQMEHAGVLVELGIKADQASVAQDLGGNPAKAFRGLAQAWCPASHAHHQRRQDAKGRRSCQ